MKKAFVIGSLLVVLTLSLGGSVASKSADGSATYEQLKLFTEVLSIVQTQYVDEVAPKDLIYSAIKGTLRGLDPHSSFLDPDSYKEMQVETKRQLRGLGIEIAAGRRPDRRVTHRGHAGVSRGAADRRPHREDRRPGDQGHAAAGRRQADARQAGTKVTITSCAKAGPSRRTSTSRASRSGCSRSGRPTSAVCVAYIKLRQFQEQSPGDMAAALEKAAKTGMKALILDLATTRRAPDGRCGG